VDQREERQQAPWFTRALLPIVTSRIGASFFRKWMHRVDVPLLRLTGGRVSFASAYPVLLLSTTGARSGKERTVPLLYVDWGGGFGVIGTRFGSQQHPGWYHNLRKNPEAVVEINGERYECIARETDGDERVEIWQAATQMYEGYDEYAPRAKRKIPVLVLTPKAGDVS
jgi:deazaflavin-dependent oxidoreductase (nitroreductase family)